MDIHDPYSTETADSDIVSVETRTDSMEYDSLESRREDIDRAAMRSHQNLMKKLMR